MLKRLSIGRVAALGLAPSRKPENFEKHARKLLCGIDVEFAAGILINAFFSHRKPFVKRRGKGGKPLSVELEAYALHIGKHMR